MQKHVAETADFQRLQITNERWQLREKLTAHARHTKESA